MKSIEESFEGLLGRPASPEEKEILYRLKEHCGFANNDAVWAIFVGLVYHLTLYKEIPEQIGAHTKGVLADIQDAARAAVKAEASGVQKTFAAALSAQQSKFIAAVAGAATPRGSVARPAGANGGGWGRAGLVLFGGLAMVCGYGMGQGHLPFWVSPSAAASPTSATRVIGALLGAPAGWMAFALAIPTFWARVRDGWQRGRAAVSWKERTAGWVSCGGAAAAAVASVAALLRFAIGV